jgi:hypothetical protein
MSYWHSGVIDNAVPLALSNNFANTKPYSKRNPWIRVNQPNWDCLMKKPEVENLGIHGPFKLKIRQIWIFFRMKGLMFDNYSLWGNIKSVKLIWAAAKSNGWVWGLPEPDNLKPLSPAGVCLPFHNLLSVVEPVPRSRDLNRKEYLYLLSRSR